MSPGVRMLVAALPFLASAAMADDAEPALGARTAINLAPGDNWIAHFAPDGRPAHVIMGLDVDGEKRSLIYMVMLRSNPDSEGTDWQVAGMETAPSSGVFVDTILDRPNADGISLDLQFEHVTLDGKPETILRAIDAHGLADRCNAMVTIIYYRLVHEDKPRPVDRFKIFSRPEVKVECVP